MKTTMRNLTLTMALFLLAVVSVNAQQLGLTGLYKHGTNESTNTPAKQAAEESNDTVTVTAAMDYFVMPDPLISPTYVYTSPNTGLNSTFTWTPSGGTTGMVNKNAPAQNWKTITWGNVTGLYTLNVKETANTGPCGDALGTTINVAVINKPTVTGDNTVAAQCLATPAGAIFAVKLASLTSDLPVAGNGNKVRVNYTIKNPDASVLIAATNIDLNESATPTSFNVTLTGAVQYGNYTCTINSVSDRISRKSSVAGNVTTGTITLTVNPIPVTGSIYHLPNN